MKQYKLLYRVGLFIFMCTLLSVHYSFGFEFESEKDAQARVGRQYWILPNPHIEFYAAPDTLSKHFQVTDETSFVAKAWLTAKYPTVIYPSFYKVEFITGKTAYIKASDLDSDDYWFKKYVRTEVPQNVEERIKLEGERIRLENEERAKEYERIKRENDEKLEDLMKRKIGQKLPPNYEGDNFNKIFVKYFETLLGKGKFEKSDVYKNKLRSINLNEIYALKIIDKENLEVNYNPDSEIISVSVAPLHVSRLLPETDNNDTIIWPFIVLKTTKKKVSSYIGSNAFGAKKMIKKYEAMKYGVQIEVEGKSKLSFAMPIHEAKKYKDNMSVLLICKPQIKNDLLAFIGGYYREPTFSEPVEINYAISGLNMELLGIWIYDSKTGKVHYKEYIESTTHD